MSFRAYLLWRFDEASTRDVPAGASFYGVPGSITFLGMFARGGNAGNARFVQYALVTGATASKGGPMKHKSILTLGVFLSAALVLIAESSTLAGEGPELSKDDKKVDEQAQATIDMGRQIFRFDTFRDQAWWGDTLRLHQSIAGAANGGVGPGVSPKTALA